MRPPPSSSRNQRLITPRPRLNATFEYINQTIMSARLAPNKRCYNETTTFSILTRRGLCNQNRRPRNRQGPAFAAIHPVVGYLDFPRARITTPTRLSHRRFPQPRLLL